MASERPHLRVLKKLCQVAILKIQKLIDDPWVECGHTLHRKRSGAVKPPVTRRMPENEPTNPVSAAKQGDVLCV